MQRRGLSTMHKYFVLKQSKAGLRVLQASPFSSALLLQQLLRRIPDPSMCLEVTEQSLDQHPSLATSHFLANYLTTHFYGKLTAIRHCEIQALYMGSKVKRTSGYWESMPKGRLLTQLPRQNLPISGSSPAIFGLCYIKSLP